MDEPKDASAQRSNPLILVAVLLLFGIVLGGVGLQRSSTGRASVDWPTVDGRITATRIQPTSRDGKNEYRPIVQYSYRVDGQSFSGDRISASDEIQKNRGSAEDILAGYPTGGTVAVHYDPENPATAVLQTGVPGNVKVLLVAGVACFALALLIGISALRAPSPG